MTGRLQEVSVQVVFDTESYPPIPLGTFLRTDEDAIWYHTGNEIKTAPQDCVSTISVDVPIRPAALVVVIRDPDAANDFATFGGPVRTYDIDAGYMDLKDKNEYREWSESHEASCKELEKDYPAAAAYIREIVQSYGPDS